MVNYGVSRACETCKKRHKKCDESRPSCKACLKGNRECAGYKDDAELIFRRYNETAKKRPCDQSVAESGPSDTWNSVEDVDLDFDNAQLEQRALAKFFSDYCVVSSNRSLSRGYLNGLESLLNYAGPTSDIAQACKMMAFACFGKPSTGTALRYKAKAKLLYPGLLRSFTNTISNPANLNNIETLMTAVVLGLYEIVTATETEPSNHGAHSRGVAAILHTENSPFDLLRGSRIFQLSNPLLLKEPMKTPGLLAAPASDPLVNNLDALLFHFMPLFNRATSLLRSSSTPPEDIACVRRDAMLLNEEYSRWPASQRKEFQPAHIGFIRSRDELLLGRDALRTRVDSYFDLYVAAIWNTYRKARLTILDFTCALSARLDDNQDHSRERAEAQELIDDMIASIPYHLTDDPQALLYEAENTAQPVVPGKPVGGLLLMHPLYVASLLSIVPERQRSQMKECLAWIGIHMGIGQATVFSKPGPPLPRQYVADGHVLVWAGMVIQPI